MMRLNLAPMRHVTEAVPSSGFDRSGRPYRRKCWRCGASSLRRPHQNLHLVIDAVKRMGFGAVAVTTVPPNSTLARDVQTTEEAPPGYPNSDIIF